MHIRRLTQLQCPECCDMLYAEYIGEGYTQRLLVKHMEREGCSQSDTQVVVPLDKLTEVVDV